MQPLYRILTEWSPQFETNALAILRRAGIDGFTMVRARGAWKDVLEESLVIEITGEPATIVRAVARNIRRKNGQQAVMIQTLNCEVELCTE